MANSTTSILDPPYTITIIAKWEAVSCVYMGEFLPFNSAVAKLMKKSILSLY